MGRKTNSMGYKKGFATYQKIKSKRRAPDFGTMYVDRYGDREMTLILEYCILGFDPKECHIFFAMGEYAGSLFCTKRCGENLIGKAFTAKVKPCVKDRYQASDGSEWVIPLYFCDELNIEVIGTINTTDPQNAYGVDLTQPGPPVRILL